MFRSFQPRAVEKQARFGALLNDFFEEPTELVTTTREYPSRVQADLQRALEELLSASPHLHKLLGVHHRFGGKELAFADMLAQDQYAPKVGPLEYQDVDIGEDVPRKCLKQGLWLFDDGGTRYAALLKPATTYGQVSGLQLELAVPAGEAGAQRVEELFTSIARFMSQARTYRGKVLSLEKKDHYTGESSGISIHKLKSVERDEVILPPDTLELLERNVFRFFEQQEALVRLGLSAKKGLLFYGPPGTGKTHTIQYISSRLSEHTTLIITSEQVGLLGEYMILARLLQPSIVVIEDADLIARQRDQMNTCEEVLLNRLLNEMDGLGEEAQILFVLTTNRPETLEGALSGRPGRIDQAIEFPLPDKEGRKKLLRLYSRGLEVPSALVEEMATRTEAVSAAFIKELMRRTAQMYLERGGEGEVKQDDVDGALDELLRLGGSLNARLLGVSRAD